MQWLIHVKTPAKTCLQNTELTLGSYGKSRRVLAIRYQMNWATCSTQTVNQNTNAPAKVCKVPIKRTSGLTVIPFCKFWWCELPSTADNRDVSVVSNTFVVKKLSVQHESFFMQARKLFHARSEFLPFQAVRPSLMSNKLACPANKRFLKKAPGPGCSKAG